MKTYIDKHKQRFLDELMTLLRMPSISADSAYQEDVLKTADAVAAFLKAAGANNVDVCETPGYPVVYGDYHVDDALPTVLVYGHYDVQPADPLDLWDSEPFNPVVKVTDIHDMIGGLGKGKISEQVLALTGGWKNDEEEKMIMVIH